MHYPRLDTILGVEDVLKRAKTSLSKNEIDRRLSKKIMRQTLNVILDYLHRDQKIDYVEGGIVWTRKILHPEKSEQKSSDKPIPFWKKIQTKEVKQRSKAKK